MFKLVQRLGDCWLAFIRWTGCVTAHRHLVRLVLWSTRALVSTSPRHGWAKHVYWLPEPSHPLYMPFMTFPELETAQKPTLRLAPDYNFICSVDGNELLSIVHCKPQAAAIKHG